MAEGMKNQSRQKFGYIVNWKRMIFGRSKPQLWLLVAQLGLIKLTKTLLKGQSVTTIAKLFFERKGWQSFVSRKVAGL